MAAAAAAAVAATETVVARLEEECAHDDAGLVATALAGGLGDCAAKLRAKRAASLPPTDAAAKLQRLFEAFEAATSREVFCQLATSASPPVTGQEDDVHAAARRLRETATGLADAKARSERAEADVRKAVADAFRSRERVVAERGALRRDTARVRERRVAWEKTSAVVEASGTRSVDQHQVDALVAQAEALREELRAELEKAAQVEKSTAEAEARLRAARQDLRAREEAEAPRREQVGIMRSFVQAKLALHTQCAGVKVVRVDPVGKVYVSLSPLHETGGEETEDVELSFDVEDDVGSGALSACALVGSASHATTTTTWMSPEAERALAARAVRLNDPGTYLSGLVAAARGETLLKKDLDAAKAAASALPPAQAYHVIYNNSSRIANCILCMGSVTATLKVPHPYAHAHAGKPQIELVGLEDACTFKSYTAVAAR